MAEQHFLCKRYILDREALIKYILPKKKGKPVISSISKKHYVFIYFLNYLKIKHHRTILVPSEPYAEIIT